MCMKRKFAIIGLSMGWFAVITQLVLILINREDSIPETLIKFFSYFTICTNILVATFFTAQVVKTDKFPFNILRTKGALTALTACIFIVGLVYQVALRSVWEPKGIQILIDELLHSIIPLYMLYYWFISIKRDNLQIKPISAWLAYPLLYILFVLLRGHFSNYYPYPFLNVTKIGYSKTFLHICIILGTAIVTTIILVFIGKQKLKTLQKI